MHESPASSDTRFVLVRHGRRAREDIASVHSCEGLAAEGVAQIEALGHRFASTGELGADPMLFSSTSPRAVQTAEVLGSILGIVAREPSCDFCEPHLGDAEGVPVADLWNRWPTYTDIPGAVTWEASIPVWAERLRQLATEHRGRVVVIACHAGYIAGTFVGLGGIDWSKTQVRRAALASVTEWTHFGAHDVWQLDRYNDTSHLGGDSDDAVPGWSA